MSKIKICGIRFKEDVEKVNKYQPDFCGFICCDRFKRFISKENIIEYTKDLNPNIKKVGVFVDDDVNYVASYVNEGVIDMIQLHGSEDEKYLEKLKSLLIKDVIITKAYKIRTAEDIEMARNTASDYVLLDNGTGTGESFDWSLIKNIGRDYFLAGGINPNNIKEALETFHPYCIDISSGVETDGKKDENKIKECIEIVRNMEED